MRHRSISAFLLCTAIALPVAATAEDDAAIRHSDLLLAQADATDESDPLAPFLKRTTPTPPDAAEEETTAEEETAEEETAEEKTAEPKVDAPNVEEATDDTGIEDLPRKSLPKTETAEEDDAAEEEEVAEKTAPEKAEPEVVVVREPTSMAAISPNMLFDILSAHVDEVEVDPTGGDTTLEGRIDGTPFQIYFYECDGGDMSSIAYPDSECLGFEWRSYFFDMRPSTRAVNEWNASYHYGKLFIDRDGDLTVQLNVVVEGGIEERNILTTLAWFRAVLDGVKSEF
ncbi:MAG: YbjN domain-containing protein [Pseudomonadota bacterium]